MTKRLLPITLCLALLFSLCLPAAAADSNARPAITNSLMAVLYEETTDTFLYVKSPTQRNPVASMTKIMTALLVLEYDPDLSGQMVVPAEALTEENCYWMLEGVHLQEGEKISVRDLMNYLLICSGNEAATTLAIYVAGDIPTFLEMMNARAKELGMTQTSYSDPHGLSAANLSTCEDMLLLAREAMKNELFREIVKTTSGALPASNKRSKPYRYSTTNRVMYPRSTPAYDGGFSQDIIGIKTGSTSAAGLNLACCMEYEGMRFYSVVMHAGDVEIDGGTYSGHYVDTLTLMTYARGFQKQGYAAGDIVTTTSTKGSLLKNVPLTLREDVYLPTTGELEAAVQLLPAGVSVKAGDVLGTLTLSNEASATKTVDLIAAADASTSLLLPVGGVLLVLAVVICTVLLRRSKKHAE